MDELAYDDGRKIKVGDAVIWTGECHHAFGGAHHYWSDYKVEKLLKKMVQISYWDSWNQLRSTRNVFPRNLIYFGEEENGKTSQAVADDG